MSARIEDLFTSPERMRGLVTAVRELRPTAQSSPFEHPRKVPGEQNGRLSPLEALALTRVTRPEVELTNPDLWLTERRVDTVHATGIMLGGQWFWSDALVGYVSGDKSSPQRNLAIRYDRSLLARGVLRKVILIERDPQGRLVNRIECGLRDEYFANQSDANRERVLRARAEYVRILKAKVAKWEHELLALETGTDQLELLLRDMEARRKSQRRHRREPILATPVVFGEETQENADRSALRRDLASQGGSGHGATSSTMQGATGDLVDDDLYATFDVAPAPPPPPGDFGARLGGSSGIDVED